MEYTKANPRDFLGDVVEGNIATPPTPTSEDTDIASEALNSLAKEAWLLFDKIKTEDNADAQCAPGVWKTAIEKAQDLLVHLVNTELRKLKYDPTLFKPLTIIDESASPDVAAIDHLPSYLTTINTTNPMSTVLTLPDGTPIKWIPSGTSGTSGTGAWMLPH
jgi:hypothetical protein